MYKSYLKVNISTLKAKLSSYVKEVKNGGEFIVLDRNLPVAKMTGFNDEKNTDLQLILPRSPDTSLKDIKGKKIKGKNTDIVSLLLEDRYS